MKHVAIDLGGRESQICIREADGTIVEERRYQTRLLPRLIAIWRDGTTYRTRLPEATN